MNGRVLSTRWSEAGEKLVGLAEAVPAERYELRPAEGVRSCAEQLRHVAFWNDWLSETLRGSQPDGSVNELDPARYPGKPQILEALRESFQRVVGAVQPAGDQAAAENILPMLEHVAEHYGQLVVYCRLGGVVPPASRG